MQSFKNILLINFGGIGDEILFLPVIQSLKKTYPEAKITLCLEGRSKGFLSLTNLIDNSFFIDIKTKNKYFEMLKLYFKARRCRYDLVISSGANPLIALLLYFTGIKTRIGYKTSNLSKKLLTYAIHLNQNQYAANMYFDLVRPIVNTDFELPKINIDEVEREINTVIIHPGVSKISVQKGIIKIFGAKVWAELIKKLLNNGKKVILTGGPDDEEVINQIRNELNGTDLSNFTDMYGKTKNMLDFAKLVKSAQVLICSDSAPMHIGVATNTKTIAIFGPTNEKKLFPQSDKFIAITNNCDCRPCLWDKRQTTCNELKCLNIDTDNIISLI